MLKVLLADKERIISLKPLIKRGTNSPLKASSILKEKRHARRLVDRIVFRSHTPNTVFILQP